MFSFEKKMNRKRKLQRTILLTIHTGCDFKLKLSLIHQCFGVNSQRRDVTFRMVTHPSSGLVCVCIWNHLSTYFYRVWSLKKSLMFIECYGLCSIFFFLFPFRVADARLSNRTNRLTARFALQSTHTRCPDGSRTYVISSRWLLVLPCAFIQSKVLKV